MDRDLHKISVLDTKYKEWGHTDYSCTICGIGSDCLNWCNIRCYRVFCGRCDTPAETCLVCLEELRNGP